MDKVLLNVKEVCDYLGIGQTKAREIINRPENSFTLRIGNRLYVHKNLLDKYLMECAKNNVEM